MANENSIHFKVVLIVGVYGACRREEILKLTLADIEDMADKVTITIPNTKTKIMRQFVITKGNAPEVDMLKLFRQYAQMRPAGLTHSRFFVGYRAGKCTKQVIGINAIAKMPKTIADFLKLPSSHEYTGHCFRRSSASLLADSGVDISTLKRHGGWKSSAVAEGYVENSLQRKKEIAEKIFGADGESSRESEKTENMPLQSNSANLDESADLALPSTSTVPRPPECSFATLPSTASNTPYPVQFNNLTACTINFYQNK